MNKPYFAKYLPVEGEIKEGDLTDKGKIKNIFRKSIHTGDDVYETETFQRYFLKDLKKIKLFLCSKNTKAGDIVKHPKHGNVKATSSKGSGVYHFTDVKIGLRNEVVDFRELLKVIGEISPEATWVKEGNEFDEADWGYFYDEDDLGGIDKEYYSSLNKKPQIIIKIKGQCGHFH